VNRSPIPPSGTSLNRRELLRTGGLVVTLGTLVAACGANRTGPTSPGRLGVAPPPATLPEVEVVDTDLLRTAQSLEYTALAVYEAAAATGALSSEESALADRFVDDHTRHAAAVGELIVAAGAEEFACANPFLIDRLVDPVLAALEANGGTDDLHRDVLNIAWAVEQLAGESYQSLVVALTDPALRKASMQIGGEELRHATVLARAINPDQTFSPAFGGGAEAKNDEGFLLPYGIPSVFGKVSGFELIVGARNAEGARFSTQLQTPAANTIVYSYQSC
jgi:rubrerythrin